MLGIACWVLGVGYAVQCVVFIGCGVWRVGLDTCCLCVGWCRLRVECWVWELIVRCWVLGVVFCAVCWVCCALCAAY